MTKNKNVKRNAFLKYGLLVMTMVTMLFSASAQAPPPPQPKAPEQSADPNRVYSNTETIPSFPGGLNAMGKFLGENIRYPAADRENNVQGKVLAQFVVELDGRLTNIKILRSPSKDMSKETERVLALSPKWKPGLQNGKPVRAEYTLPVSFTLSKG